MSDLQMDIIAWELDGSTVLNESHVAQGSWAKGKGAERNNLVSGHGASIKCRCSSNEAVVVVGGEKKRRCCGVRLLAAVSREVARVI